MAETPEEKKTREDAEAAQAVIDAKAKAEAEQPPWGDDDAAFDAEKAKALILNLRDELKGMKAKKPDTANAAKIAQLEAELEAIRDKERTELERERVRADNAEKKLKDKEDAETEADLRKEIADASGIKPSLLRGKTREELEAHAKELVDEFKITKPKAPPADGQGDAGSAVNDGKEMSADEIVTAALKH